jgi:hypothetical protein
MSADQTTQSPMLIWRRTDGTQVEYDLTPELPVTVGRDPSNRVAVDSAVVSKEHAVVRYESGNYVVEDLKSSNGTRLNGAPIATSLLSPGDRIEIGNERFVFVDASVSAAAAGRPGLSKGLRLALAAFGTLVVLLVLLVWLAPPAPDSGGEEIDTATGADPVADPAVEPVSGTDETLIAEVVSRAQRSGVEEVGALYDEAQLNARGGRLRQAEYLFAALLGRDTNHEAARQRLATVQEVRRGRTQMFLAEAQRAFGFLQFQNAELNWEQALFLLESSDSRVTGVRAGLDQAREQLARD